MGNTASWSICSASTDSDASRSDTARPMTTSCEPPFSMLPEASSIVPPPGMRRPSRQAMPLPQTRSASMTLPVTRTAPVIGLFHPTATPVVGPGCTARLRSGRMIVLKETAWFDVLTTTLGVSFLPSPAGRSAFTAACPSTVSTGVVSSASGPLPAMLIHCRRAYGLSWRAAAKSVTETAAWSAGRWL